RAHRMAAILSCMIVLSQIAVQMYLLLPFYSHATSFLLPPLGRLAEWRVTEGISPISYDDHAFATLLCIAAIVAILGRYRLGLLAYFAMLVVRAPVVDSVDWVVAFHRLIPTYAVETIVAGMGAYALASWISMMNGSRRLAIVPGAMAALYVLVQGWGRLTQP